MLGQKIRTFQMLIMVRKLRGSYHLEPVYLNARNNNLFNVLIDDIIGPCPASWACQASWPEDINPDKQSPHSIQNLAQVPNRQYSGTNPKPSVLGSSNLSEVHLWLKSIRGSSPPEH